MTRVTREGPGCYVVNDGDHVVRRGDDGRWRAFRDWESTRPVQGHSGGFARMRDAVEALSPDTGSNASRAARGRPVVRLSLPADVVAWLRANAPPSRARAGGGVSALVERLVRSEMDSCAARALLLRPLEPHPAGRSLGLTR